MKLVRYEKNPILTPSENWWEENLVFNAGATIYEDKVILLYRAQGRDNISRFGLAVSTDGFNFERFDEPAVDADPKNPFERLGIEDPRITKIGDTYHIFYTAASVYSVEESDKGAPSVSSQVPWRIRASTMITKDFKKFERRGFVFGDLETKDLALFPEKINGKYALLHRVYPNMQVASSEDLVSWRDEGVVVERRPKMWDSERIGAGAPPIKTEKGWLEIYHGADENHVYSLGVLLLDLKDPTKVLYRSLEPILEPQENFEKDGYVKNVVFTCGVVEKEDQYFVYYGGADKIICLATVDKKELLDSLT